MSSAVNTNEFAPAAELCGIHVDGDGGVPILRGVDLRVERRERLLITGPSGSGKSTVLRTLLGIETPKSGNVSIGGEAIRGMWDNDRRKLVAGTVGVGFQAPGLDSGFTVLDNLRNHYEMVRKERTPLPRLAQLLGSFGLKEHIHRYPNTLSGGEQQRVALVRALLPPSELIVLDEPTSMLDEASKYDVTGSLADLAEKEGSTVVMVSHDQVAASFATRVVDMKDGQIEAEHRAV